MTAPFRPEPFRPDELDGVEGITPEERVADARLARDLEAVAGRTPVVAPPSFADRVMAAVAAEPVPAPARAAGHAIRTGAFAAFLAAIRDAFRVTFSGGFPAVVRAQALAVVLVAVAVGGGVTFGAASALGLLDRPSNPGPVELPSSGPSVGPDASQLEIVPPTPAVSATPEASPTPDASALPDASESAEPDEASEPPESPDAAATDAGNGSGPVAGTPPPTRTPSRTPKPTPRPTPKPTATPTDDHEDSATETPKPTETPHPTETPTPTSTSGRSGEG